MLNERKPYRMKRNRKKSPYPKFLIITLLLVAGAYYAFDMKTLAADTEPAQKSIVAEKKEKEKTPAATTRQQEQVKESPKSVENRDFGNQDFFICIHKLSHTLEVFEKGKSEPVRVYECAVAKNHGDKQRTGDNTTPTSWGGVVDSVPGAAPETDSAKVPFVVDEICDAKDWTHDFGDGKGEIEGAYGPWFISINTGWDGIGIHGTHDPESIGTDASEGCIQLHNKDIAELKEMIAAKDDGIGVKVVISED